MAYQKIRLRVDAPYPGESLSSFLGRAAQFYRTPFAALLTQLMEDVEWVNNRGLDHDLAPSPILLQRLEECVTDWRSPLDDLQKFNGWTLHPTCRHAYCPFCFEQDMAAGRTPYFRNDWIPVFASTCWQHATPLFPWRHTNYAGRRAFPAAWLYQTEDMAKRAPAFMIEDLAQLRKLAKSIPHEKCEGLAVPHAIAHLAGLQAAVENPAHELPPAVFFAKSPSPDLVVIAQDLVKLVFNDSCYLDAVSRNFRCQDDNWEDHYNWFDSGSMLTKGWSASYVE